MPQNRREPQFLVSRLSAAPRDPPLFVIFALFRAEPLSCDGRKIFAHKIAKMTKIWDQRIGASCRTDASMQARRDPSFPQRVRDINPALWSGCHARLRARFSDVR